MATAVRDLDHYRLPARLRVKKAPADGFSSRLALADRIADLPNIHTVDEAADTLPCCVNVYLRAPCRSMRREHVELLLCSISRDGVEIHGLGDWDRHQVIRGKWGRLERGNVLVFLPRDDEELEVCWSMIQRAYQHLVDYSAKSQAQRIAPHLSLPRFSRTALQ